MLSAECDYDFLLTRKCDFLVNTFVEAMKGIWPDAIVHCIDHGADDESERLVVIDRDKDMQENWDWQISTDTDFSGEGQVQLEISEWGFQEMEILVKRHLTKSPDGLEIENNYDTTIISTDLRMVSLGLPWNISENAFCANVYIKLKDCITNATKI